jgi:hypothetical protein
MNVANRTVSPVISSLQNERFAASIGRPQSVVPFVSAPSAPEQTKTNTANIAALIAKSRRIVISSRHKTRDGLI